MIVFILILLILAALAQFFMTRNTLRNIEEDFIPEQALAEPGEVFFLRISLKNTGRQYLSYIRFTLFLQEEIKPQDTKHCRVNPERKGTTISYTTWLKPHQTADFRIPVMVQQRGRYIFQPLYLYGGDFFGLKEEVRAYDRFREVVIAPKETSQETLETAMGGILGDVSVRRFLYEDPVLTAGFREYTGQEPMRKISWTQSAKGKGLMVKNDDYTVEPTVSVILNVDLHGKTDPDLIEPCFSLARTVCRILEDRRIPYDLKTNTLTAGGWYDEDSLSILTGTGSAHFAKVLELLGRATDMVRVSDQALLEAQILSKSACGRILITTKTGMPQESLLRRLQDVSSGSLLILTPDDMEDVL